MIQRISKFSNKPIQVEQVEFNWPTLLAKQPRLAGFDRLGIYATIAAVRPADSTSDASVEDL